MSHAPGARLRKRWREACTSLASRVHQLDLRPSPPHLLRSATTRTLLGVCVEGSSEQELWRHWALERSAKTRERLFAHYTPLALRVAKYCFCRWPTSGADFADARQLALMGLVEAIDGFDPDEGASFGVYARKRIRGAVFNGLTKASEIAEQVAARRRARRERMASLGAADANGEVSTREALRRLVELATGLAIGIMLEDARLHAPGQAYTEGVYEQVAWRELMMRLRAEVAALPERERTIIERHYGGLLTFEGIAGLLGLTRANVSQIHRTALMTLRKRLGRRQDLFPD